MVDKLAVIAIGGNSLIEDPNNPGVEQQWESVRKTSEQIVEVIAQGWNVVVTHGNGPQAGYILRRSELASAEVHGVPLDVIVADTQGSIGYMLQQSLDNAMRRRGINRTVMSVVTQVRVEADDPAFQNPAKPIGGFMSEDEARQYESEGWQVVEDAGRGWRRVVASPAPLEIHEINAIRALVLSDYIVIAVGGGGVPVVRDERGNLRGALAVIDKDRASALLAYALRADLLLISTGVEKVCLHYKTSQQRDLDTITLEEAQQYIDEGHFAPGSMLPKIQAAMSFLKTGGPRALITNPANLLRALEGETGTQVIPG